MANEKIFNLGQEKLTIGRSNYNALVLDDEKVSRSHAEIHFEDGYYVVEDLNSTNGVQVNDQLIHKMLLKSGDRITLGRLRPALHPEGTRNFLRGQGFLYQ